MPTIIAKNTQYTLEDVFLQSMWQSFTSSTYFCSTNNGNTKATATIQMMHIAIQTRLFSSFKRKSIGRNKALCLSTEIRVKVRPDTSKVIPAIRCIVINLQRKSPSLPAGCSKNFWSTIPGIQNIKEIISEIATFTRRTLVVVCMGRLLLTTAINRKFPIIPEITMIM